MLRPTTTISVTRPRFGAQTASTPLKHWGGPRIAVPDSFTMPSDLFDPSIAALDPSASIASCFDDGDHVWIDLDCTVEKPPHLRFQCQRFIESGMSRDGKRMSSRTLRQLRSEIEVNEGKPVERNLLVRRRHMSDENMEDDGKERRVLRKLLTENIAKSKIPRLIRPSSRRKKKMKNSGDDQMTDEAGAESSRQLSR